MKRKGSPFAFASPSFCLRDSAFALHLRHTMNVILRRVLLFSVPLLKKHLRLLVLRRVNATFPKSILGFVWYEHIIHNISCLSTPDTHLFSIKLQSEQITSGEQFPGGLYQLPIFCASSR